uniref:Sm domain-containing protein n=1 Tax=Meloidogyne incognita TaxID=6306 RepID=A0A914MDU2_MELIC
MVKLGWFVTKLSRETVTIELKNNTIVTGTIVEADTAMNIHLRNVQMSVNVYKKYELDSISIRGNNIRTIILPDSLPLDILLIDDEPRFKSQQRRMSGRGRGAAPRGYGRSSNRGGSGNGGARSYSSGRSSAYSSGGGSRYSNGSGGGDNYRRR